MTDKAVRIYVDAIGGDPISVKEKVGKTWYGVPEYQQKNLSVEERVVKAIRRLLSSHQNVEVILDRILRVDTYSSESPDTAVTTRNLAATEGVCYTERGQVVFRVEEAKDATCVENDNVVLRTANYKAISECQASPSLSLD